MIRALAAALLLFAAGCSKTAEPERSSAAPPSTADRAPSPSAKAGATSGVAPDLAWDAPAGWQKVDNKGDFNRVNGPDSADTNRDRMARDRSADSASFQEREQARPQQRQQFDRSSYNNRYHGQMGGFRGSAGGGRFGGGRMGGGFRR